MNIMNFKFYFYLVGTQKNLEYHNARARNFTETDRD